MHLVDFLISPLAMQKSMDPIVCVVFHKEIHPQLQSYFTQRRQWQPGSYSYKLNGRIGDELKGSHNKEEHAHNRFVAAESIGKGKIHLGLDFVRVDRILEEVFEKEVVEGEEREDEEEEDDVVAIEDVVGLGGGVIEPKGLRRREGSAEGGLSLVKGGVRQHCRCGQNGNVGVGMLVWSVSVVCVDSCRELVIICEHKEVVADAAQVSPKTRRDFGD